MLTWCDWYDVICACLIEDGGNKTLGIHRNRTTVDTRIFSLPTTHLVNQMPGWETRISCGSHTIKNITLCPSRLCCSTPFIMNLYVKWTMVLKCFLDNNWSPEHGSHTYIERTAKFAHDAMWSDADLLSILIWVVEVFLAVYSRQGVIYGCDFEFLLWSH